jgi:LacI family transcriptional regulator
MNKNIPIVVIDRAFENEKVPHVVLDNYKAGYIAGEYLSALGHTDIACITGSMKITLCRERFSGFQQALNERGIELLKNNVYEGDFSFQSGLTAIRALGCEGGCRFTAVFAMNDLMALGVMKGLHSSGSSVPDDVSVLGMDDLEFGNMVTPALSSIHYPFRDMVEQALNLLLMQIEEERLVNDTIILDPRLSVKESTETCRVTQKEMERIRNHE